MNGHSLNLDNLEIIKYNKYGYRSVTVFEFISEVLYVRMQDSKDGDLDRGHDV